MRLIRERRSYRSFRAGKLPLADLANILRGSYGLSEPARRLGHLDPPPRSVPSAGALYPLEVYVAVGALEGVANGLYHYDPIGHSLGVLRFGDVLDEFAAALIQQHLLRHACALIIFTSVFRRTLARYGARGYRYILLEAGHAAQNACLIATELRVGTLCLGGYFDSRLNQLLGLDGRAEAALYCTAVGYPAE
jgi:SagB-type dehydrogenase family enzyme